MTKDDLITAIERVLNENRTMMGLEELVIGADTQLVGEVDSLDLASLILELETMTELAPFADGMVPFATAGDLADLHLPDEIERGGGASSVA